jgi:hypothetical protein
MSQHDTLLAAFETYKAENEKFIEKGVKASAARARKALQEIAGACKELESSIRWFSKKLRCSFRIVSLITAVVWGL